MIQTLDHVAQCYGISNVGFVKIDVEGNEYDVLLGAEHTLQASNYPPILFECDNPAISAQLFLFMFNLKYNIVRVRGVSNMYLASRPHPLKVSKAASETFSDTTAPLTVLKLRR